MKTIKKVDKYLIPCEQRNCGFLKKGCQECEECKAPPNLVDERCQRCFDCENKPNELRWGDNYLKDLKENVKIKEVEKKPLILTNIKR